MKILFWSLVTLASGLFGLGELIHARYIAGETMAEAILLDDGQPQSHEIRIAEADLPIRLNLKMWGARHRTDIVSHAFVTLTTGGQTTGDTIGFQAVIEDADDIAYLDAGSGNVTLRSGDVPGLIQSSQLFETPTPGLWTLRATVSDTDGFDMQRIEATILRRSRAVNWSVAGPGLAGLFVGFIMLVRSLRKRFAHLAS